MVGVNVVCVGKLKEVYWREACAEYQKRLGAFCRFGVAELCESKLSQNPSEGEIRAALAQEGRLMQPYIAQKGAFNVALCVESPQLSSEEFSKKIQDACAFGGASVLNFYIGSSYGLDEEVKKQCDLRLGMSRMTFPHQLARVVLFEQIYRAFEISGGKKYHK